MKKNHIILIGMPASGKSTVGVLIAKALGYSFVDSDLIIQARAGNKLQEIIDTQDIPGFLALEEEVNLTLGNDDAPTVIATGGSAIYSEAAMEHFRAVGTVVYLELPYRTMAYRLGDFSKRGVIMPEGYTLRRLYDERCALCERYAHITVHEGRKDRVGDIAKAVVAHFQTETPAQQN
ncbi:MAG: shikimate kinase [Clostridia bacterium]|nr:shikimate kinase [Clostridia bacterium]